MEDFLYDTGNIHKFRQIGEERERKRKRDIEACIADKTYRVHSYNLLHNFENPLDREPVSRTALRRYAISRVPVKRSHRSRREIRTLFVCCTLACLRITGLQAGTVN